MKDGVACHALGIEPYASVLTHAVRRPDRCSGRSTTGDQQIEETGSFGRKPAFFVGPLFFPLSMICAYRSLGPVPLGGFDDQFVDPAADGVVF